MAIDYKSLESIDLDELIHQAWEEKLAREKAVMDGTAEKLRKEKEEQEQKLAEAKKEAIKTLKPALKEFRKDLESLRQKNGFSQTITLTLDVHTYLQDYYLTTYDVVGYADVDEMSYEFNVELKSSEGLSRAGKAVVKENLDRFFEDVCGQALVLVPEMKSHVKVLVKEAERIQKEMKAVNLDEVADFKE